MADRDNKTEETDTLEFQVVDKRKFLDLNAIDKTTIPEEKPRYPSYVEELISRMAETERKFQEKKKQIDEEIGRTKARLENDFERKLALEKQKIILQFLEVMDNLERALDSAAQAGTVEHLLEGVHMTASLFRSKLQTMGVEVIPALNQPFDPNLEQAIGTVKVKDPAKDGIVVEEAQSGYCMNGRLLRPAQVRVGRC
ncbi:MAG TPA: nucleotide exchange factor GrpE [Acidobacteriota bacterium]|nr:nucleotide exchange factor GrpE [Acidobacteriota bacterium]